MHSEDFIEILFLYRRNNLLKKRESKLLYKKYSVTHFLICHSFLWKVINQETDLQ